MKSTEVTFLTIILMFLCTTISGDDDEVVHIDTNEFSSIPYIYAQINEIENKTERYNFKNALKMLYNQGYSKGSTLGHQKVYQQSFMAFFECGVGKGKWALKKPYDAFRDEFKKPTVRSILSTQSEKLPKDFLDKVLPRDDWINLHDERYDFKTSPTPPDPRKTTLTAQQLYVEKFTDYYKKWLYIIRSDLSKHLMCPLYLYDLQVQLHNFYNAYKKDYDSEDEFERRVAASFARDYMLLTAVDHNMMQKLRTYAMQQENEGRQVQDMLFDIIPSWYLTNEDVMYLNILVSSLHTIENFSPIKTLPVKNRYAHTVEPEKDEENDWVVIPYDDSTSCGYVDVDKLFKNTPKNYMDFTLGTKAAVFSTRERSQSDT